MSNSALPKTGTHMIRNVSLLSICLALSMTGNVIIIAVVGLAGEFVAPDFDQPTLPLTLHYIGLMLTTIPANMLMRRIGRRAGFTIGQLIGVVGALISYHAIMEGSFTGLCIGGFCLGMHNGFWNFLRFAASETATKEFRSRAISYVMAGGVLAAIAGPQFATLSTDWFEPALFAGCYMMIAILCFLTTFIVQMISIPRPKPEQNAKRGRPIREIAAQPFFIVALMAAMIGYGAMSLVMTATPLAMKFCGFEPHDSNVVISWHALAMFAPSFFTGHLIKLYGNIRIIAVGTACMFGAISVNLTGIEFGNFAGGLVLLGLGWNFMFIGGTTLLTNCYEPEEQHKVQAFNDFFVSGTMILTSWSAGYLQKSIGWQAVNIAVIAPLLLSVGAIVWLKLSGNNKKQAA